MTAISHFEATTMNTALQPLMSSAKHDWRTPVRIIEAVNGLSGGNWFDFCTDDAAYKAMPAKPRAHTTLRGLHIKGKYQPAAGGDAICDEVARSNLLWCNPPYGTGLDQWILNWNAHTLLCSRALILVPARTDTRWFTELVKCANHLVFIRGRLHFNDAKDPAPFPSVIGVRAWQSERGFVEDVVSTLKAYSIKSWVAGSSYAKD